jgi:thymidylate kinase
MAILDIRGTNGAGKSWIVHQLLEFYKETTYPIKLHDKIIGYGIGDLSCGIVGSYERECGGCDSIKTAALIEGRVRAFAAQFPNVIFEGITVAHTYFRYNHLAKSLADKHAYHFLFLSTPLELCIERVRARRLAKGNVKEFNPEGNNGMGLVSDYDRVLAAYTKLVKAGRSVITLDHRDPLPTVLNLLGK